MDRGTSYAIVIPVAAGEEDVERAADLLDSLCAYETGPSRCVLIDDAPADRRLTRRLPFPAHCDVVTLVNPRRGRGDPLLGGQCTNMLSAYREIWQRGPVDFILKLETDTLVIGPFRSEVERALARDPGIGLLGTLGRTCNRRDEHYGFEARSRPRFLKLLDTMSRTSPRAMPGQSAEQLAALQSIRKPIERAAAFGYRTLEYCQGGAYVLSYEVLDRLAALGYLSDPLVWSSLPFPEDVMMGMYTRAAGARVVDLSADQQPFGSHWRGLPHPPAELVRRGHKLISSVKNDPLHREADIRAYFLARRRAQTQGRFPDAQAA